jgi:hypothetical protein
MQVLWSLPSRVRMELPWSSILTLFGSDHKTCMKHANAECTVDSSWWWAEEMPETCRALWQNKIWIISASSWLFNYEVCHDAWPREYKIRICYNTLTSAFNLCIIVVLLIQGDFILSDNSPCHALLPRFTYETSTCNWQGALSNMTHVSES